MVRVILAILGVLAITYWLAAPDPVTAGARTAAGTGVSAAGAGIRDHWSSGRDSRALTRTKRRDRWSKDGGFWRNLLRLEHGAVITGKGVKGAAGITRAAVKPVPAAVKAGWVSGRDRHRAKAGNRPVPVALDPPWWRREQPQVQPGEQAPEQPAEQVQVQAGDGPEEQVQAGGGRAPESTRPSPLAGVVKTTIVHAPSARPSGIPGERRCEWCGERPQETKRGKLAVCSPCGEEINGQVAAAKAAHPPVEDSADLSAGNSPQVPDWDTRTNIPADLRCQHCDSGRYRYTYDGVRVCSACAAELDRLADSSPEDQPLDTEKQIRSRRTPAWNRAFPEPLTESDRRFWTARDAGDSDPLDQDGRPGDPDQWPFKSVTDPTDTTTDPTAMPTPTEGDPVFTSLDTDLDDLTTVQDFALKVADMAEESDFAQLVEFCKNASDEVRDFGADMAGDVAEFEEVAAKIGDLLSELVDAATKVKERGAELVGG